ncbi:MAG: hypothetical protein GY807_02065 [Gammaproteobacteria bacterium]|nr:hypothetical protein [Gammaproteobacteria bacterium]
MLYQKVTYSNHDMVGRAYYEWREAANAWTNFYGLLKQDAGQATFGQRKRLRALEKQLNEASDKYLQVRSMNEHKRVSLA